jgi:hypothetical protein
MASGDIKNPPTQPDSKSGKKKKVKAAATLERTGSPAQAASETAEKPASNAPNDATQDDVSENAHIREIRKSVFVLVSGIWAVVSNTFNPSGACVTSPRDWLVFPHVPQLASTRLFNIADGKLTRNPCASRSMPQRRTL